MFFVLQSMKAMNHMYQFVLGAFLALFRRVLATAPRPPNVAERLAALESLLQTLVLQDGARSLFKADRLPFALHFAHGLRPALFGDGEWEAFTGRSDRAPCPSEQVPRWVAEERKACRLPDDTTSSLSRPMLVMQAMPSCTWPCQHFQGRSAARSIHDAWRRTQN